MKIQGLTAFVLDQDISNFYNRVQTETCFGQSCEGINAFVCSVCKSLLVTLQTLQTFFTEEEPWHKQQKQQSSLSHSMNGCS
jgi:hypothetical protein